MPCEETIQVVGTLTPQESRTLLSNQLAQCEFFKMTQKQQSFRKEPKFKRSLSLLQKVVIDPPAIKNCGFPKFTDLCVRIIAVLRNIRIENLSL
ncbi:hypothetical protein ACTWQL_17645 [Pseudalkalibacillus sp. R45]|uniref:hypothetical protein n=1 Tax=Pseudalkalibacillus sp. R45 TaxID=3457433 RepID=UPI003FCE866F